MLQPWCRCERPPRVTQVFWPFKQIGAVGLLACVTQVMALLSEPAAGSEIAVASDAGALDVLDSVHDHFLLLFRAEVNYVGDGVEVGNEGEGYASVLMELLYQENLGKFVYRNTANYLQGGP